MFVLVVLFIIFRYEYLPVLEEPHHGLAGDHPQPQARTGDQADLDTVSRPGFPIWSRPSVHLFIMFVCK